jgi:uncharacterized membrane protein
MALNRKIRWQNWVLPLSLSLNALLGTAAAVHFVMGPPHRPPPGPEHVIDHVVGILSPADATIVRAAFDRHKAALESNEALAHALPERLREVLRHEPLDEAALLAVVTKGRAAHNLMDDALTDTLMEAAPKISPEGRAKLADMRPPGPPGPPGPPPPHF